MSDAPVRKTCHDHDQAYWSDEGCPVCNVLTEVEALRRENARLREALVDLEDHIGNTDYGMNYHAPLIARIRAALQGETE